MVAGLVLVGGSAAYAQIPGYGGGGTANPVLIVNDDTVVVGQTVEASGTGWTDQLGKAKNPKTGILVHLAFANQPLTDVTSDDGGNFFTTFVVPDLPQGDYPLTATAGDTTITATLTLHVGSGVGGESVSSGGGSGLARTGSNLMAPIGVGTIAVVLGGAAVYGTRRRRDEAA